MTTVVFDVGPVKARLLDACSQQAVALDTLDLPTGPGAYLIRHAGNHPLYRRFKDQPIYVGRTANLRHRIRTHRRTLEQAVDLNANDFTVVCIGTESRAIAALYEELLIAHFRPVWNQPPVAGFGNRDPGARRRQQRVSPFDRLHPGRAWVQTSHRPCPEITAWVHAYD